VNRKYAIVVSGLCRSGTSMLMQMLEAGGIEPFIDEEVSRGDKYNPFGYYESAIEWDQINGAWVRKNCLGKAVKIVTPYLEQVKGVELKVIIPFRKLPDTVEECKKIGIDLAHPSYKPCTRGNLLSLIQSTRRHITNQGWSVETIDFEETRRNPLVTALRLSSFIKGFNIVAAAEVVKTPAVMKTIRRQWYGTLRGISEYRHN
jgi:hypothetical protein